MANAHDAIPLCFVIYSKSVSFHSHHLPHPLALHFTTFHSILFFSLFLCTYVCRIVYVSGFLLAMFNWFCLSVFTDFAVIIPPYYYLIFFICFCLVLARLEWKFISARVCVCMSAYVSGSVQIGCCLCHVPCGYTFIYRYNSNSISLEDDFIRFAIAHSMIDVSFFLLRNRNRSRWFRLCALNHKIISI